MGGGSGKWARGKGEGDTFRWVYGLDHNGQRGQGEGKKAEEQTPWRLLGLRPGIVLRLACSLRPGTVLRDCVYLTLEHTHSPSVRLTRTAAEAEKQRPHKETNRQVKQAG
jgi:hypothetical protein